MTKPVAPVNPRKILELAQIKYVRDPATLQYYLQTQPPLFIGRLDGRWCVYGPGTELKTPLNNIQELALGKEAKQHLLVLKKAIKRSLQDPDIEDLELTHNIIATFLKSITGDLPDDMRLDL